MNTRMYLGIFLSFYVRMFARMYVRSYLCLYVYVWICVCVKVCMCVSMYVCKYVRVCVFVNMYVCMHAYMSVAVWSSFSLWDAPPSLSSPSIYVSMMALSSGTITIHIQAPDEFSRTASAASGISVAQSAVSSASKNSDRSKRFVFVRACSSLCVYIYEQT